MTKIKQINKSIDEKELTELKSLISSEGQLKQHMVKIELDRHELYKVWDDMQLKKNLFQNVLREKYGEVQINTNDGTITKVETKDAVN